MRARSIITCTRRLQFCAGHRVLGHEGKCSHLHGHNFVVEIEAEQDSDPTETDSIGRVIDFCVLKDRVGGWIDKNWDHGFIYAKDDYAVGAAIRHFQLCTLAPTCQKAFEMDSNPTAENLAEYLLTVVCPDVLAGFGVRVVRVAVHETENGKAEATLF